MLANRNKVFFAMAGREAQMKHLHRAMANEADHIDALANSHAEVPTSYLLSPGGAQTSGSLKCRLAQSAEVSRQLEHRVEAAR